MTTSSAQQPVVTVSGPGDLVSLVPYLVGFRPRRSLVVLSLRGERLRCGLTARFDLPREPDVASDGSDEAGPPDLSAFAEEVAECVLRDEPTQVALLVYDHQPWMPGDRPWQHLVDALEDAFEGEGVPVKEAAYVGEERFWSFTCGSSACCPDAGSRIADVRSSPAAAAFVMLGRAPLDDRDDLVRRVAPRGPVTTSAVAGVAQRELGRRAEAEALGACAVIEWQTEVLRTFADVVARSRAGEPSVTGDEAGLLVAGLLDVQLRDEVMESCTAWLQAMPYDRARETGPSRPCRYDEDPVTAVLLELSTMSDGDLAVAPLTLLAAQLWGAGEGALANAAVERALTIDPDYRLALLLGQVLRAAIPPAWAERSGTASRMVRD